MAAITPAGASMADSIPADSVDYVLAEVTVAGRRPNVETIPVQVLSGDELQRLNSNSVADALR